MRKLLLIFTLIILSTPTLYADKTVADLNPDFEELMVQALRPKNEGPPFAYRNEVQPLSLFWFTDIHGDAEEFGRLIRGLLRYSRDGEVIDLDGNERFFAKRMMNQEDINARHYAELSAKRSEAGRLGALSRWHLSD